MAQRHVSLVSMEFAFEGGRRLLQDDENDAFFDQPNEIESDPEDDHVNKSVHDTASEQSVSDFDDSSEDPDYATDAECTDTDTSVDRPPPRKRRTQLTDAASRSAPASSGSAAATSSETAAGPSGSAAAAATPIIRTCFNARDGTHWYTQRQPRDKSITCDELANRPGPRAVIQPTNALEAFDLFITEDMWTKIIHYTNLKLDKMRVAFERHRDAPPTNKTELRAVVGLLYAIGLHQSGHANVSGIWAADGYGIEVCRLIMTEKRFRQLLTALRFDNIDGEDRKRRLAVDKLTKIREFWEPFIENCQRAYKPSCHLTVDEMLIAFRGNCQFRQYIKSKAAKYGLKVHALCDAETYYTLNMELYAGEQPEQGAFHVSNRPTDVVLRLTECVAGSGRTIVCDNWYSSYELAVALNNRNLNLVGTINKSRRFLPRMMVSTETFKRNAKSVFLFNETATIVSYYDGGRSKKRVVPLISTKPEHDNTITTAKGVPAIVSYYNQYKSGVDCVDRLKVSYSLSRVSKRWPLTVFYAALNIISINACVVLRGRLNNDISRRLFIRELSHALMYDQARVKAATLQMSPAARARINVLFPPRNDDERQAVEETRTPREGRCYQCTSSQNRRTRSSCSDCGEPICGEHRVLFCTICAEFR